MTKKLYAQRDIEALDDYGTGSHYFKHVLAMTGEGLHSKSSIAAELGVRDAKIEFLLGVIFGMDQDVHFSMIDLLPELIYEDEGGV